MNRKPLVSVIIATYRREESLRNAITSVINQTYDNIEIVLIDDNAEIEWNKKVRTIVDSLEKPVNYILNEINLGSAETRNKGISNAHGEYITFLDDDDIYLPEKIESQVFAMKNSNSDYSITDLKLVNEKGKISEIRSRKYLYTEEGENLRVCHLKYHMTGTDTMMFKKQYLIKINSFESIDVGDEFYLMMKAIDNGGSFLYVPKCDVLAVVHTGEGGLSSGESKIHGENALFQYKKQYFEGLNHKDIRYIKMRHYAVLAFAYLRAG